MRKVTVHIDWINCDYESIKNEISSTQLYAFSAGREMLYVGKSYRQHVNHEAKQSLRAFGLEVNKMEIYTGLVTILEGQERMSAELIADIERLLVYTNQPTLNTHYLGKIAINRSLTVYNRGDHALVPNARYLNGEVFVALLAKGNQHTKWMPFSLRTLSTLFRSGKS